MNTVNLLDVLNGTADTSNRTLSAADVEKSLQKGGLLDEVSDIDLRMLQFEFSGLGFRRERHTSPLILENFLKI